MCHIGYTPYRIIAVYKLQVFNLLLSPGYTPYRIIAVYKYFSSKAGFVIRLYTLSNYSSI